MSVRGSESFEKMRVLREETGRLAWLLLLLSLAAICLAQESYSGELVAPDLGRRAQVLALVSSVVALSDTCSCVCAAQASTTTMATRSAGRVAQVVAS